MTSLQQCGVPFVEDLKNVPDAARSRKGNISRKKDIVTSSTKLVLVVVQRVHCIYNKNVHRVLGGKHMQIMMMQY